MDMLQKKNLLFLNKIEKKSLVDIIWEKIGLMNGKILFGVMNQDLNYSIMILEIRYDIKKMNDIKLNI